MNYPVDKSEEMLLLVTCPNRNRKIFLDREGYFHYTNLENDGIFMKDKSLTLFLCALYDWDQNDEAYYLNEILK